MYMNLTAMLTVILESESIFRFVKLLLKKKIFFTKY